MKLSKLEAEAVRTSKREKVERLNDDSLKRVFGGGCVFWCPWYPNEEYTF